VLSSVQASSRERTEHRRNTSAKPQLGKTSFSSPGSVNPRFVITYCLQPRPLEDVGCGVKKFVKCAIDGDRRRCLW